jgi:hypothetical protein
LFPAASRVSGIGASASIVLIVERDGGRRRATYVRGSCRPSASRAVGRALESLATPRAGELRLGIAVETAVEVV